MFIHTKQPLITSFYIKRYQLFAELAMSQRWSTIFYETGVLRSIPIGLIWDLEIRKSTMRNCPLVIKRVSNYQENILITAFR